MAARRQAGHRNDPDIVTSQAAVAGYFKVRRGTVGLWISKGMPGEVGRWSIKAIEEWRQTQKDEEELLASTADSPWLEELRKNKALQEQIKLATMRRTVIQIDRMQDAWGVWSSILKRLGERVGRKYGRDAGDMVTDALDDCERVMVTVFASCEHGNGNDRQTDGRTLATDGPPGGTAPQGPARRKARTAKADKRVGGKRANPAKRPVQKRKVQTPPAPRKSPVVLGFGFRPVE